MTISHVARVYDISPSLIFHWRRTLVDREGAEASGKVGGDEGLIRALQARVCALEGALAEILLELETLREAVRAAALNCDTKLR